MIGKYTFSGTNILFFIDQFLSIENLEQVVGGMIIIFMEKMQGLLKVSLILQKQFLIN